MTKLQNKILLHACPRCHGDLFPDVEDNAYACLQCGRRIDAAQLVLATQPAKPALAPAA